MARIRTIKPTFFMSRAVRRLNDKQKLVWIGLWPNADDEGRLLDEPGILAGQLWSLSVSEAKLHSILDELHTAGRIIRYIVDGESYIQVTNWFEHQRINRPAPSLLPPPPFRVDSLNDHGTNSEASLGEGKGRERKGGGGAKGEPASKCSKHLNDPNPPKCGACGDARREHDSWVRAQKNRPTVSGIVTEPTCSEHGYPFPCKYCPELVGAVL